MKRIIVCTLAILMTASCVLALPSAPRRHFDDRAGIVSSNDASTLAATLAAFETRTNIQMVVTVLPEMDGEISDFCNRLYESWGIGSSRDDRGVLVAIFPEQGQSRIEVGYGLEGDLPDVIANRILAQMLEIPRDQAAQRLGYVMVQVAARVAPGDPLAEGQFTGGQVSSSSSKSRGRGLGNLIWLLIIFSFMGGGGYGRRRWLGPLLLMSAMGGGRSGGGGGFGGGGFSGGGGMSGGGGASGGW
jgi:uncharacterized protein